MTVRPEQEVAELARIGHDEAMRLAAVENQKFATAIRAIASVDAAKPTDCPRWNVHDIVAHVVGSAAGQASPREFVRQVRTGRPVVREIGAPYWWDGMNEVQVRERASASMTDLVDEWGTANARALRARRKLPRVIARLPLLNLPAPVGRQRLSYLFDIGFTRDVWMHRIDIAVATGTTFDSDAVHDGRILADIVAEWAGTHGEPFTLHLTGPAGGEFGFGTGGEHLELDAVEFARTLAGRLPGDGVLANPLPL
jgi:uncharacterized protein (TIGR03083 family)